MRPSHKAGRYVNKTSQLELTLPGQNGADPPPLDACQQRAAAEAISSSPIPYLSFSDRTEGQVLTPT